MGGLIICVLMVFCENEKLDMPMFAEPPDGLLEPKKHKQRTCVARGACTAYCAPENAFQINSREPENRIRIIELIEKRARF